MNSDVFYEIPDQEPERQYFYIRKLQELMKEEQTKLGRPLTYNIQTFGCQMNAKDSEKLAGILHTIGYRETDTEQADCVIYNTCTVRENANSRVYGRIGYLGKLKQKNPNMKIILCGCMMQEEHAVEKIKKSYRFVDIVFGTYNIYKLAELLYDSSRTKMVIDIMDHSEKIVEDLPSERKFSFKAGVNIMYGCNNFCSYCIVPYVRGRERSRGPADILNEIKAMVREGVSEVMLLGQNVNSYGLTLSEPISFSELLQEIEKIDGLQRIRFMTSHPKDLSDELIQTIKNSTKIARHLHLPLQSGSTEVLRRMNRKYTKEDYLLLVSKIKSSIPDIALTTDIIVGFPGETEEDFLETLAVVNEVGFHSAYTFLYSKRSGTPAASAPNQVSPEVAKERFDRLLSAVSKASERRTAEAEGMVCEVLVEEKNNHLKGMLTGRLSNNLLVHFKGNETLLGAYKKVLLKEAKGFYYMGELL